MFIVNHMVIGALKSLGAAKPPIKEKAVGIVLARAAKDGICVKKDDVKLAVSQVMCFLYKAKSDNNVNFKETSKSKIIKNSSGTPLYYTEIEKFLKHRLLDCASIVSVSNARLRVHHNGDLLLTAKDFNCCDFSLNLGFCLTMDSSVIYIECDNLSRRGSNRLVQFLSDIKKYFDCRIGIILLSEKGLPAELKELAESDFGPVEGEPARKKTKSDSSILEKLEIPKDTYVRDEFETSINTSNISKRDKIVEDLQCSTLETVNLELLQSKTVVENLKKDNDSMEKTNACLKKVYDSLKDDYNGLKIKCDGLNKNYDDVKRDFIDLEINYDCLKKDLESLRDVHAGLKSAHESLKRDQESLKTDHKSLKTDYKSLKTNYESLKIVRESLKTDHERLKTDHENLKTEHESLKTDHESLRLDYDSLKTTSCSLQTDHERLMTDHVSLKKALDTIKTDHVSLNTSHDSLKTVHGSLKTDFESLSTVHNSLSREHDNWKIKLDELQVENKRLRKIEIQLENSPHENRNKNKMRSDIRILQNLIQENQNILKKASETEIVSKSIPRLHFKSNIDKSKDGIVVFTVTILKGAIIEEYEDLLVFDGTGATVKLAKVNAFQKLIANVLTYEHDGAS